MRRIELARASQVEREGHTSKGDQPKWLMDGIWYKADHMGYESLAEIAASRILQRSTVSDYVVYEPVLIQTEEKLLPGCASRNFRGEQETLIPLERLHRAYHGEGLAQAIGKLPGAEERLRYTVDFVVQVTGLAGFGRYLATTLALDAFVLNEDRHTNNLAVIRNDVTKAFRLCPLFDHGLSFLSDTSDYPLGEDVYTCMGRVKAKPFSTDFWEQAEAAAVLYGSDLHFTFTGSELPTLLDGLDELYDAKTLTRAELILREQMRRYGSLFA